MGRIKRLAQRFNKCLEYVGIEGGAGVVAKLANRFIAGFYPVLGAGVDKPVVVIGDGDNPGAKGDINTFETFGVALAIPAFVVITDIGEDVLSDRDVFQHIAAGVAVIFVGTHFPGGEIGDFRQHRVGDGEMADIMQQSSATDSFNLIAWQAHFSGYAYGIVSNLLTMQEKFGVFQFDERNQEADDAIKRFASV